MMLVFKLFMSRLRQQQVGGMHTRTQGDTTKASKAQMIMILSE